MGDTVGIRIEALAKQKGLPQGAALAAHFGVSYETLRKWREGESAPNRSRQQLIAEKLGVAPEAFMFGSGAGGDGAARLSEKERSLLQAFRRVLKVDRERALSALEARAAEVDEIVRQVTAERLGAATSAAAPVTQGTSDRRQLQHPVAVERRSSLRLAHTSVERDQIAGSTSLDQAIADAAAKAKAKKDSGGTKKHERHEDR